MRPAARLAPHIIFTYTSATSAQGAKEDSSIAISQLPPRNSKAKGEISEGIVLVQLLKQGYRVCIPFGDNQRYDLVVEENNTFVRAQVKTGKLTNGSIIFKVASINGFTGKRTAYKGQVDIFLVYCPETDAVYRVPIHLCGASNMSLRVDPVRRIPRIVHWAKDFEL